MAKTDPRDLLCPCYRVLFWTSGDTTATPVFFLCVRARTCLRRVNLLIYFEKLPSGDWGSNPRSPCRFTEMAGRVLANCAILLLLVAERVRNSEP